MTWIIARIIALGVPPAIAKPLLGIIAALALLAAFLGLKSCYDHGIIDKHEAKQEAATAKADRAADTKAAEQRRTDDARLTTEADELNRSTDHAQTDLDRRLAFQRCLRLQQAARSKHGVVPACH